MWRLKQIEYWRVFVSNSWLSIPRNDACALYMTKMQRVRIDGNSCASRVAHGIRPFRETLAKYFVLLDCPIWYTLSIPTPYITSLPTNVKEYFWEKTLTTNLEELEIVIPTYLYTFACEFSSTPIPLHFHTIERLIAQTLTSPFQSVKWGFGATRKYWKKPDFGGCNRTYCGIRRAKQDTIPRSFVRVGAWRA